jgi:hypothetical protein
VVDLIMGVADFVGLLVCLVTMALLVLALALANALGNLLDKSIAGYHPFHGLAVTLHNTVAHALTDALHGVEGQTAGFFEGIKTSLEILVAMPILAFDFGEKLFNWLYGTGVPAKVEHSVQPVRTTANQAYANTRDLATVTAVEISRARRDAQIEADSAVQTAELAANAALDATKAELHIAIRNAQLAAQTHTDNAVARLQSAEETAIANAIGMIEQARVDAQTAADAAVQTAEQAANLGLQAASDAAAQALREAQALGQAALSDVKAIAVGIGDDVASIEHGLSAAGAGALIAAIPAIATLVGTIAVESGLENAACRGQVKGICQTDPTAWAGLLAGLAALGFGFSLRELVQVARPLVADLTPIIREAA